MGGGVCGQRARRPAQRAGADQPAGGVERGGQELRRGGGDVHQGGGLRRVCGGRRCDRLRLPFQHASDTPTSPLSPPQAKKYDRAIAILAKHQWWDKLIGVVRQLDKGDARCLGMCAQHFRRAQNFPYAKETLLKMDDTKVRSGWISGGLW